MLELLLIAGIGLLAVQLPLGIFVGALLRNSHEWEDAQRLMEHPDAD